jgi:hypothetical protein
MTQAGTTVPRVAGLFLLLTGTLAFLGSFETWGSCPTTPCGGPFMAFSEYSGVDLGFGVISAVAGLVLIAIGLVSLARPGAADLAGVAALAAVAITSAAVASILWMFVIPGDDKEFVLVPVTAAIVAIMGLIALGASRFLRGRQVSGNSPT